MPIQPGTIRACKERHTNHEENGQVFSPDNRLPNEIAKDNIDKDQRCHEDERRPDEESFYSTDQEIKLLKHEQY